ETPSSWAISEIVTTEADLSIKTFPNYFSKQRKGKSPAMLKVYTNNSHKTRKIGCSTRKSIHVSIRFVKLFL
ncbi:hypothetical protein, partial [Treponema sp.]|uniref:hypothetical protein n=1 Tax=Treponema sp. TaxID=166 RepID=UPI003F08094B